MRCTPKQQNQRVNLIIAVLLVCGAVFYAIPPLAEQSGIDVIRLPFNIVTFAAVISAVFVIVRYKMTSFTYVVKMRSDIPDDIDAELAFAGGAADIGISGVRPEFLDFVVSKAQGARPGNMECVLSMADLVLAVEISRTGKNLDSLPKNEDVRQKYIHDGFVFYDYTVTLWLERAIELVFVDGTRYVGIIIEPDEQMKEYFMKKSPRTKL